MVLRLCSAHLIPWSTLVWIFGDVCEVTILKQRSNFSPNYWLMHYYITVFLGTCEITTFPCTHRTLMISPSVSILCLCLYRSVSLRTQLEVRRCVCSRNKNTCRISSMPYTTQVWLKKSEEIKNTWRQWKWENTTHTQKKLWYTAKVF